MSEKSITIGRRERKRLETRQQILTAAASLFATRGYENTSIDDIAGLADIARGTIFYNFESKESIVFQLRVEAWGQFAAAALEKHQSGLKAIDCISHMILHCVKWCEDNPELAKVFFIPKGPLPEALIPLILIQGAQEEGSLRADLDAEWLGHLFTFLILHGQGLSTSGTFGELGSEPHINKWTQSLLAGIAP
ncbi:MAG: TetR/AcrR family transcriptional regulator [Candidatus Obscuribacterales bacterium]|nr:TetR/AcrR family transcriptional regulator [Candidatus Obscuribacterales bacterium]